MKIDVTVIHFCYKIRSARIDEWKFTKNINQIAESAKNNLSILVSRTLRFINKPIENWNRANAFNKTETKLKNNI